MPENIKALKAAADKAAAEFEAATKEGEELYAAHAALRKKRQTSVDRQAAASEALRKAQSAYNLAAQNEEAE